MRAAGEIALEDVDRLVCLGVPPTAPITGYGYLLAGRPHRRLARGRVRAAPLAQFVEKPSLTTARQLIRRGALWNSGMFVWSIPAIARALQHHLPQITRGLVMTVKAEIGTRAFDRQLAAVYRQVPAISIDYGVMEQAVDCWMVTGAFTWDDVGSWTSAARYLRRVRGAHAGCESRGNIVIGEPDHLTATLGVKDLVIVQHRGVTLVAHRSHAQQVRRLVATCQETPAWRRFL